MNLLVLSRFTGVPIVLPLVSENQQDYKRYKRIFEDDKNKSDSDIHLN